MENCSVTLCCVVGGKTYWDFANKELAPSAVKYFFPTFGEINFLMIGGEEGWPNGTMYRWHRLLEKMPETDYVFLCDADMRFEHAVGPEILSPHITLTLHPGYVGLPERKFPYENNVESDCYVSSGEFYFAGGFAGGPRKELKRFANEICSIIDSDVSRGIIPRWHDESALNCVASHWRDLNILDPSFCYPDNDSYYRKNIWKVPYQRKLVALDKSEGERGNR